MEQTTRLLLRLPTELHQRAKAQALRRKLSLNSVLVEAIKRGLASGEVEELAPHIIKMAQAQFGAALLGLMLYGSRARGDAYQSSDTDLLLVLDGSIRIERELYRYWDDKLPSSVSLVIADLPQRASDAGSLWLECALDAKIIYDPTGVVRRRLSEIKERILSGAVVRRTTHGQGYWIEQ